MLVRVRDNRHLKRTLGRIDNRQTDPVHGDRPFFDRDIARRRIVFERIVPTAVGLADRRTARRLVDMPLHDMTVQQRVGPHTALQIDQIAFGQPSEVRLEQRLADCRDRIAGAVQLHNRQAHAVVRDALIDLQLPGKRTFQREMPVSPLLADRHDPPRRLYNSRKHNLTNFF